MLSVFAIRPVQMLRSGVILSLTKLEIELPITTLCGKPLPPIKMINHKTKIVPGLKLKTVTDLNTLLLSISLTVAAIREHLTLFWKAMTSLLLSLPLKDLTAMLIGLNVTEPS